MKKLTDRKEIKEYVKGLIRSGNRELIQKALKRYAKLFWQKPRSIVEEAERIFEN